MFWIRLAILLVAGLAYYFRVIWYGYVSDDLAVSDSAKVSKSKIQKILDSFFSDTYHNPKLEHAIQLAFHLAVVSMIYVSFGGNYISFMAALLFLFNPTFLQGGIWLSGKGYTMAALACLVAYAVPSMAMAVLIPTAMMSLNTVLLPLIFLFTPYKLLALSSISIAYFYYRTLCKTPWATMKESSATGSMADVSWKKLILGFKTFAYYVHLVIIPRRLGMYHDFGYRFGWDDKETKYCYKADLLFVAGLAYFLAMVAGIVTNFYGLRIPLLWFISTIIIFCNFGKIYHQLIAERYAYLPGIGLMVCLATLLTTQITFLLLGYYIVRNALQIGAYKNDDIWLEYNLYDFNFPHQTFVYMLQGVSAEKNKKDPDLALRYWYEGLKYAPLDDKLNFHIGNTLCSLGMWKEALPYIKTSEENLVQVGDRQSLCHIVPKFREIIERKIARIDDQKNNPNYDPLKIEFAEKLAQEETDERKLREQEVVIY